MKWFVKYEGAVHANGLRDGEDLDDAIAAALSMGEWLRFEIWNAAGTHSFTNIFDEKAEEVSHRTEPHEGGGVHEVITYKNGDVHRYIDNYLVEIEEAEAV